VVVRLERAQVTAVAVQVRWSGLPARRRFILRLELTP